jgi:glycosyltransferase involved in cell wall biosynthesis
MKVLLIGGLTGRISGWIPTTTRHLVRAVAAAGGTAAYLGDVSIPASPQPQFFTLDYPPKDKAEQQIRVAIDAFQPDLIHVSCGGIALVRSVLRLAASAAPQPIPCVFTAHNIPPAEKLFTRFFGRNRAHYLARNLLALPSTLLWRQTLRGGGFHSMIVHSQTVKKRALAGGCPQEKIKVISLGADLPAEHDAAADAGGVGGAAATGSSPFSLADSPKLLCVAGMIHHKGQHDLVRAARILSPKFPKLKVALLGARRSDHYAAYLEELVRKLKLENTVRFAHRAPDPVLAAAWADADLYVQPSHEEGFCFSFLEGLMAVPRAIGTSTGAMAEMAGNDPLVRIVRPGSPNILADAAGALLALPAGQSQLAERRERLCRAFSWDRYVADHVDLYRLAAAGAIA